MASDSIASGGAGGVAVFASDPPTAGSGAQPSETAYSRIAAEAALSKKGERTVVLEVGPLLGITDEFVITSGANARQVKTIAEEIEKKIKEAGGPGPASVEGLDDARWVLLDYGDFVCHVFVEEARAYYDIERLWSDAPRTEFA